VVCPQDFSIFPSHHKYDIVWTSKIEIFARMRWKRLFL